MGRTRVLDLDQAIATATEMFWRQGYERTSLADLTTAMHVTPPSFYFAFGSKEGLFRRVLDHYLQTRLRWAEEALNEPTALQVAEVLLTRLAKLFTDKLHPPGCLIVNCSLPYANDSDPVRLELRRIRDDRRARLRERFRQAQNAGDLPADTDPADLARFLMVVSGGMAFEAQSGATRKDLRQTVRRALTGWPHYVAAA